MKLFPQRKIVMFLKLASFQSDVLIHVYVNFVRFNHKSKIIMFLKLISFQSSVLVHLPFSVHQFGQITKRPTTADADYLNLKTNAEWQFKPFDPELAQYITLPDNETVVIDNVSPSEKEPTFVNTNTNTADLVVNDSNVGMMGVFPNPFFFGNQRWDYYEIGVTKLVSIGNLNTINMVL